MKPTPRLSPPSHHSTADWDFQTNNWTLSSAQYHSPPTALITTKHEEKAVLSRLPDAQTLPQGRLVFWDWIQFTEAWMATFRNQAPLGTANRQNCYYIAAPDQSKLTAHCILAGGGIWNGTWTHIWPSAQWLHWRLTWWNGTDPQNNPALAIQLEREIASVWLDLGTLYDPANTYADSPINRPGLLLEQYGHYHDDTEIWVPL